MPYAHPTGRSGEVVWDSLVEGAMPGIPTKTPLITLRGIVYYDNYLFRHF